MSAHIKICVAGATGNIGSRLVRSICEATDLELVGAVSRSNENQSLSAAVRECPAKTGKLIIQGTVAAALKVQTDVLIDYTHPDSASENVREAIRRGVHVVIGTSGLRNDDYANFDALARQKKVGVIAASNFSLTLALLQMCAIRIAKYIPQWELIDYANADVALAPLGTTRELAHRLSEELPLENKTDSGNLSRGEVVEGTPIHSVRLPGHIACVEAIFGAGHEQLVLRHVCTHPSAYVAGTLLAVRKVASYIGLIRGLDRVLELS